MSEPTVVRCLHLSDFHFKKDEHWNRRTTLQALLRHVKQLKERDQVPDLVLITGDIAFSGRREEYDQAIRFFTKLAETLSLNPPEHFFFVPGNHDVDRGKIGVADDAVLKSLDSQEAIEAVFKDPQAMRLLGRRLEAFYAFTESFLGAARRWREEQPWRVDVRTVRGVEVAILQLNSAWASGKSDEADGLLVGKAQVQEALEQASDAFLRLALVHHPIADLRDFDREPLETLFTAPGGAPFLFRGHLHRNRTHEIRTPDGTAFELAAGAAYPGENYKKLYLFPEFDLAKGEGRVHYFRFSDEGRGFWAADTQSYENAPDGVWRFRLPAELRLANVEKVPGTVPGIDEKEPGTKENTPHAAARRATLTARYRTAAASVHGTVRFVGLADSRPRPNFEVPDLYVPLHLARYQAHPNAKKKAKPWTTEYILQWLMEPYQDGSVRRAVVLGDPGSGKTTLCRFVATVLAGGAKCKGFELQGEPLPLLIPFRDYMRARHEEGDHSLLEFLERQARIRLQVRLPDSFLEQALEEGRAVLLLDGLDEVGSAREREDMRDRVWAFCKRYHKVPVVITSRIAGYDEAPLRRDPFNHFVVEPFTNEDLDRFVSNWYAVYEPNDPVARDQGIADLSAALAASKPIRELARNPMLATLIALIHRFEAHLPGERAKLYALCVKTLIETWPASRQRRFKEIDEGLQLAYLESLAYSMQLKRSDEKKIEIRRGDLVDALVTIIRERKTTEEKEVIRRQVERWVDFLAEGTGLLVEQQPGVFVFFHLSLMEYLAACGAERECDLAGMIGEKYSEPGWQEVCLLAIGKEATDQAFLDAVFERVSQQKRGWSFLLKAMREEAAFSDQQRAAIVLGAGHYRLKNWSDYGETEQVIFGEILSFSMRHAAWAKLWLRQQLKAMSGEDLTALIGLLIKDQDEVIDTLSRRKDVGECARYILDFGSGTKLGKWALRNASPSMLFNWGFSTPGNILIYRLLMVDLDQSKIISGLLINRLTWVRRILPVVFRSLSELKLRDPNPLACSSVEIDPGGLHISTSCRWLFQDFERPSGQDLRGYEGDGRHRSLDFIMSAVESYLEDFRDPLAKETIRGYLVPLTTEISVDLVEHYMSDSQVDYSYADLESDDAGGRVFSVAVMHFIGNFSSYYQSDILAFLREAQIEFPLTLKYQLDFRPKDHAVSLALPTSAQIGKDSLVIKDARLLKSEEFVDAFRMLVSRMAAEVAISVATMLGTHREAGKVYSHFRIQNAWLSQIWPFIDHLWEKHRDRQNPDHEALYLALGWTQATTSHQWPATEPWIERMEAEPEHWSPRAQWHLCWLLSKPDDPEHVAALRVALKEGWEDPDRPGMAREMWKMFALRED